MAEGLVDRAKAVERRDGLLFQHVSWIAAHMRPPAAVATPPHVREADKGFDGVLLQFEFGQARLARLILCEDKASVRPRSLVTSSIWPEIKLIQADKKDREILAAITSILDTMPDLDQETIIDSVEWRDSRQFRVSLTAGADQARDGTYHHLFAGFEEAAGGEISSRLAEVMPMYDVREYLASLASRVVRVLEAIRDDV